MKKVTLSSSLLAFVSEETRKAVLEGSELSEQQSEEISKAKEFFGVEDLKEVKEFSLSLENMIWSLFEKLPAPESPLRIKAHERLLQDVATALKETLDSEEELPKIDPKHLKLVLDKVEDPDQFKSLSFPFEYSNGEIKQVIPLPSTNILVNADFIDKVDQVFTSAVG